MLHVQAQREERGGKKEKRKLAGSSLFARCLFVFIVNETSFWSQSRIDEVRIEFGFLHCGDLATAPVSRRTTLVAACRARVFVIEAVWVGATAVRAAPACV